MPECRNCILLAIPTHTVSRLVAPSHGPSRFGWQGLSPSLPLSLSPSLPLSLSRSISPYASLFLSRALSCTCNQARTLSLNTLLSLHASHGAISYIAIYCKPYIHVCVCHSLPRHTAISTHTHIRKSYIHVGVILRMRVCTCVCVCVRV